MKISKAWGVSLTSLQRVGACIRRASVEAVSARTSRTNHTESHLITSLAGTVRPQRNKGNAAFTLIELLAAVLIILILAAVIAGVSSYLMTAANIRRARAEIAAIESALESFKSDTGAYPSAAGVAGRPNEQYKGVLQLTPNMTLSSGSKVYMTFKSRQVLTPQYYVCDPWGNTYGYRLNVPSAINKATFDLWSYGPDGKNGQDTRLTGGAGADDITNWR